MSMTGAFQTLPTAFAGRFPVPTGGLVLPVSEPLKRRNTALDWLFYDVGALSAEEFARLVQETNVEGSILVVHPRGALGENSIRKFGDYESLRAAPGKLLRNFSIAGVGSSDVGAAALARNLADHLGEPVGAIVAGYGVSDLLSEALGGWFFFGTINRAMKAFHERSGAEAETAAASFSDRPEGFGISPDTRTLVNLLKDKERSVATILGHSKGCLSIALALELVARSGTRERVKKAKAAQVVTTGAVVEFPQGFDRVSQLLGSIDWFGGLNSRLGLDFVSVPGAWHHLNTTIPNHMDLRKALPQAR